MTPAGWPAAGLLWLVFKRGTLTAFLQWRYPVLASWGRTGCICWYLNR